MQKDNYWVRRLSSSRLSRRRFVGGTAAIGAGAAGLALVGCGDDDDDEGDGTPASPTATTGSGETPGATTAPTVDPNAPQSGGTINGSTAGNTVVPGLGDAIVGILNKGQDAILGPTRDDLAERFGRVSGRATWAEPWLSWLRTEVRLNGGYAHPFGGSGGAIPVEKRFYLGGATTVRGGSRC